MAGCSEFLESGFRSRMTNARLLDDVLYVESRVLQGRVKKKHVSLERTVAGPSSRHGGAGGNTEMMPASTVPVLRVGKALLYPLDPRAVLVVAGQGCLSFEEVKAGRFFHGGSRGASMERLDLFHIDLSTSDDSWGRGVLRLCFESREGLERWHAALVNELYEGNSIHKTLQGEAEQDELEVGGSMWESFLHINGMSVYTQREQIRGVPGSSGSSPFLAAANGDTGMMSSVVIRNSPAMCLKVLLQQSLSFDSPRDPRIGGTLAFADSLEVMERVDRYSSLVRLRWSCSTADTVFSVMWPRESILLRTWRKNDDGTFVIVYQPANGLRKHRVSSGCVEADAIFGLTIAPLREEYYYPKSCPRNRRNEQHAKSPESLVTLVINADVGGVARSNNLLSRLSPTLHRKLVILLLKPLVMSLVLMRDRLEQSRFVVMPSMFSQEDMDVDEDDWIDLSESSASIEPAWREGRSRGAGMLEANWADLSDGKVAGQEGLLPPATLARRSTPAPPTPSATPTVYGQYGCTDREFWSYPGFDYLKIRGESYLNDRVKVRAENPVFELYTSDLVNSQRVLLNIAKDLPSIQYCDAPYAFVLNLVFPNNPLQNLVTTWTCQVDPTEHTVDELVAMACFGERESVAAGPFADETPIRSSLRAFFKNYKEWVQGDAPADDERRNKKFKLIPRIARGSWVIKQAVGTTPVLLGQKLDTRYFRGRTARGCNYFEVDVDITSNPVANNITRLVVNAITSLVVDLAPLIEGQNADELPERLIGSVRYNHLDLRCGSKFAEADGRGGLEPSQ